VAEGLGFNPIGEESRRITLGGLRVRPVLFGRDDMWSPGVSGWREGSVPIRKGREDGPWADSLAGPVRFPAACSGFLIFFSFFFSENCFISYLFLLCFNLIQTSL
jgi:hypothetical protein